MKYYIKFLIEVSLSNLVTYKYEYLVTAFFLELKAAAYFLTGWKLSSLASYKNLTGVLVSSEILCSSAGLYL